MIPEQFETKVKNPRRIIFKMINDFSYEEIEKYLNSNGSLYEKISTGGFRIMKQNSEAIKKRLSSTINLENLTDLFFIWYYKQGECRKFLDEYFTSDQYKSIHTKNNIDDKIYHLAGDKFLEFLSVIKPEHSAYFLLFSPILFEIPEVRVLENLWFNYVDMCKNYENHISELLGKNELLQKDIHKIDSELKKVAKENIKLNDNVKILESKLNNNREDELTGKNEKIINENNNELLKLHSEIDHLKDELKTSEENHSGLIKEFDKMQSKNKIIENQNLNLQRKLENLREEKEKPFTEIINHLDIFELINSLNEPDEIKDFLNSTLIQSGEDRPFSEKSFEEFWEKCEVIEKNNIKKIIDILIEDIENDDFINNWDSDLFTDIKFSLTARAFMINLLNEILRENMKSLNDQHK